jgi:hypothetical protein
MLKNYCKYFLLFYLHIKKYIYVCNVKQTNTQKMTTITTAQIQERLSQSFNDVKTLKKHKNKNPFCSLHYVFNLQGAEFGVGIIHNKNYDRILICYSTKEVYKF